MTNLAIALAPFMIALDDEVANVVTGIQWGSIDISPITSAISDAVPVVLPVIVGIAGIRKAVSFVVGMIRSA